MPDKYTIDGSRNITYSYDSINRLTKKTIATTAALEMEYVYALSKRNTGTSQKYKTTSISEESIAGKKYSYEYDEQGNIIRINKMINGTYAPYLYYEYDQLNQLYYDMNYETSILKQYSYDEGGNLLSEQTSKMVGGRPSNTTFIHYGYGDNNWTNKLTAYNDKTITYDAIGNPLIYRDGMKMTWEHGRKLASLTNGDKDISYTYDADGVRASKIVNGEEYTYQYKNGKLLQETRGQQSFHYYYDSNGSLTAIKYRLTPTGSEFAYYVTHNW